MKRLCCIVALFLAIVSCFAQQQRTLTETEKLSGIKMLKSFYTQYITHELKWFEYDRSGLEWKIQAKRMLREELFVPELVCELVEREFLGADPVIRAHEAVEYMLKSLDVKPLDKPGWYMVNYAWHEGNERSIPVKLIHSEDGKIKIDYIMPGRYPDGDGDELINRMVDVEEAASGVEKLKSFYAQYITNVLEDKDEANEALLAESVDPFYLEYWADPKKRVQEVNENMLKSLDVEPLGSPGWYKVSWSCGAGEETILVVKFGKMEFRDDLSVLLSSDKAKAFAKGTDKMMIRYDSFFYLTPAKRKAFANESEALNNQAVELCVRNLSNQDSIDQAMELWDKAIALNHLNLHAYSSKANLLIGMQRYDEALKTLDNAICFHPENHGLYLTEGVLLEKLGRMDDAMLHYQRGLELCEYRFKKNPLLGTFIDYYLLRYSVSRKDIPNAEIIDAIPASFTKDDKDHIIKILDMAGSIKKMHTQLMK